MELPKELVSTARELIIKALDEDIKQGDITTDSIVPEETKAGAFMKAKSPGIICGLWVAEMVFSHLAPEIEWHTLVKEGAQVAPGDIIAEFSGPLRAILTGERTALNFLQRMSGIASITSVYAESIKDTKTRILDTRKTLPGFRLLDKYAVKTGGGENHRIGLYDMVMIKDNHIDAAGSILNAVKAVREKTDSSVKIEIEARSLDEVRQALETHPDIIMLDNMNTEEMKQAVTIIGGRVKTEASGNVTIERLKEIAATGVDFISVGALTHSVKAMDIGLYLKKEN